MLKLNLNAAKRDTPEVPLTRFKKYRKYGFCLTQVQIAYCPSCKAELNAGPNYMPEECEDCKQKLDWTDYHWEKPKFIKYMDKDDASEDDDFLHPD